MAKKRKNWVSRLFTLQQAPEKVNKRKTIAPPAQPGVEVAQQPDGAMYGATVFGSAGRFEKYRWDRLIARQGYAIYRDMMEDDQIKAAIAMGNAGVLSREWDFASADEEDEQQEEVIACLKAGLEQLHGSFRGLVAALLWARVEGFSVVEKVWGNYEHDGRTYWGLGKFVLRPAFSFKVEVDEYGNVLAVKQVQSRGADVEVPKDKFLWFVNGPEFDLHYGRSDLLACYKHWWAKTNLYNLWNVFCERAAGGAIVIEREKESPPIPPSEQANLQNIVTNWGQTNGLVLPPGHKATITVPPNQDAFERRIMQADKAIARALLLPALIGFSEQGDVGSYSQSETQIQAWFYALDEWCEAIADCLNEGLFSQVVEWNFGPGVKCPKFFFHKLTAEKKQALAGAWAAALRDGAVMNTYADETYTRSLLGYPEREEDADPVDNRSAAQKEQDAAALMQPGAQGKPLGKRPMDEAAGSGEYETSMPEEFAAARFKPAAIERRLYGKLGKP